jgi:tetratricopeptide (TPR) repeat protein
MLYLATNLIERSEYRRGLTLIDQLLAEYPFTPKAHLLRGLALFGLNDIAGAREEARKEFAIAGYPQAYYYAARFAKAAGDSADERRCLLLQLERCAASRRDTYVLDAVRALPAVCTPESRDSCVAILRQVGAAFGTQAETARALMRSYLQMGVRAEAESLAQQATAAGTLRKEDCDEVLREIRGTGQ